MGRGALLIGPGGRWRLECPVPGQGAGGEAAEGNDGERGWSWRPAAVGGPPPLPVEVNGAYPPVPELFCPSCLLGGYTLEELGSVTVAGRDAIAVAATPRRDVLGSGSAKRPYDRIEHPGLVGHEAAKVACAISDQMILTGSRRTPQP